MRTIFWPSAEDAELIVVDFIKLDGESRSLKLLVDSGFTGGSSFVLGTDALDLVRAEYDPAEVVGAIHGQQNRAWVTCRMPAVRFQRTLIAIITDTATLSLPDGVHGLAGLTFLRQFLRWGATQTDGAWEFFLSEGKD
jgi:hypothetical protein